MMQAQATAPRRSVFEDTNVKAKHIELPPETQRALQVHSAYERVHHCITPEEVKELPQGFLTSPPERAIYRTVSGCNRDEHVQLIHYPQPVLDNLSTAQFLNKVKESTETEDAAYLPFKEYIKQHYSWMWSYFPYAAQVAHDIRVIGALSDKAIALEKRVEKYRAEVIKSIGE
jgi:hypothetical protein